MKAGFEIPVDAAEVKDLTVSALANASQIQATDRVLCINRGRKPLTDQFDGKHVTLPPGWFQIEFDAAQHFHRRLIVPGTRNLTESDSYTSFISIRGTADGRIAFHSEADCQPFTDEQLERFGEKVEGIDRSSLPNPADRDVTTVPTRVAAAATHRARGRGIDASAQATAEAEEAAAHVLDPPDESATRDAEGLAAAEGVVKPARRRAGKR